MACVCVLLMLLTTYGIRMYCIRKNESIGRIGWDIQVGAGRLSITVLVLDLELAIWQISEAFLFYNIEFIYR